MSPSQPQPASADSESSPTCFAHLPPEIREPIWNLALPSRICFIQKDGDTTGMEAWNRCRFEHCRQSSLPPFKALKPPALASVCRESRRVALENHAGMRSWRWSSDVARGSAAATLRHWTWFDPVRDTLALVLPDESRFANFDTDRGKHALRTIDMTEFAPETETVCIVQEKWTGFCLLQALVSSMLHEGLWPGLRRFQLVDWVVLWHDTDHGYAPPQWSFSNPSNQTVVHDLGDSSSLCSILRLSPDSGRACHMLDPEGCRRFQLLYGGESRESLHWEMEKLCDIWVDRVIGSLPRGNALRQEAMAYLEWAEKSQHRLYVMDEIPDQFVRIRKMLDGFPELQLMALIRTCRTDGE